MENKSEVTEPSALPLVATEQKVSTALDSLNREVKLKELVLQSKGITKITNNAGYQECHSKRIVLKDERIAIAKIGKEARDEANKFSKAVIIEEKRLIDVIEPEEKRLQAIQDAYDAEKEAKRKIAIELERARVYACQALIDSIRALPLQCVGLSSLQISQLIEQAEQFEIKDDLEEFKENALNAKFEAIAKLKDMFLVTQLAEQKAEQKAEQERAELERQKAEFEKQRAEEERLAEQRRKVAEDAAQELEKQRAELRLREEQRLKEELESKQKLENEKRELEGQRAKLEQEKKEEQERIAKARAEEERKKKAESDAEEKFKRDQQDLFDQQQKEKERLEEEAKRLTAIEDGRAAIAKQEAEMQAVSVTQGVGVAGSVGDGRADIEQSPLSEAVGELEAFVSNYAHLPELSGVIDAINAYLDIYSI